MKRFDICALGELLIDFTENGTSSQGNPLMEANPGGAPCNVLSMMSRQGKKTAFIGKVGNDIFGRQLKAAVEEVGINTEGLVTDEEVNTTLAFVKTLDGGDREFSFYRNPRGGHDAFGNGRKRKNDRRLHDISFRFAFDDAHSVRGGDKKSGGDGKTL